MKLCPLCVTGALTLLATSGALQGAEEVLMPEVNVRDQRTLYRYPHHPQDPTYAEPPPGCVEVIVPAQPSVGFAYANAARAREGIPVIPDMNNPSSANSRNATWASAGKDFYQHPATPPGQEGKIGCPQ